MANKRKKFLVTGAAGALGSHLAEALQLLGQEVVGVDCLTDFYDTKLKMINLGDLKKAGVSVFAHDLAVDSLEKITSGVEVVYHFAAQPGILETTPFDNYVRNNIIATHRLLEAFRYSKSLKLFVYISTSSVYGARADGAENSEPKPTSYYGVTKLAAEQLALSYYREFDLPVTVLRLFSVYGERERPEKLFFKLIKAILEDNEFPLFEGSEYHKRSFTYVGDVVEACLKIIGQKEAIGEIFNIGGGDVRTTGEGISIIENLLEKKAKLVLKPKRIGDQFETKADTSKAQSILGFTPQVTLEVGLKKQVEWYINKINKS